MLNEQRDMNKLLKKQTSVKKPLIRPYSFLSFSKGTHTNHYHLHLHRILYFMLSNTLTLILSQLDEISNYCFTKECEDHRI